MTENNNNSDLIKDLTLAFMQADVEKSKLILSHGIGLNVRLPFEMAFDKAFGDDMLLRLKILKMIINEGASIQSFKSDGPSLIQLALKSNNTDFIYFLIDKGIDDLNKKDLWGLTPLMYAVQNSPIEIVEKILSKGVNVNDQNKSGDTALHLAISPSVIDLLINSGADTNLANHQGEIPYYTALIKGNLRSIELTFMHAIRNGGPILERFSSECPKFDMLVKYYFLTFNNCLKYNVNSEITDRTLKYTSGKYLYDFKPSFNAIMELASNRNQISINILHLLKKIKDIKIEIGWVCTFSKEGYLDYSPVRERAQDYLDRLGNKPYIPEAFLDKRNYEFNRTFITKIKNISHSMKKKS